MRRVSAISALLSALVCLTARAQTTRVEGQVVEADGGGPVAEAIVYFSGTWIGTQTDSLGRFRLEADAPEAAVLTAERQGYRSESLQVVRGSSSTVVFRLRKATAVQPEEAALPEPEMPVPKALPAYYPLRYVEIGNLYDCVSFNEIEGFKPRLSLRTTERFSPRLRLWGTLAVGTKDGSVKYGGRAEYFFSREPVRRIFAGGRHDLLQLGSGTEGLGVGNDLFSSVLARSKARKFGLVDEVNLGYEHGWSPRFAQTLTLGGVRLHDGVCLPLVLQDGSALPCLSTGTASLVSRFREPDLFPGSALTLRIDGGAASCAGTHPFLRTSLALDWDVSLPEGGTRLALEAGGLWGDLPYPLLKIHAGNDTYFYRPDSFSCMQVYEFASDRWLTCFWESRFPGPLSSQVPLLRAMGLEWVVGTRMAWGTLTARNRGENALLRLPEGLSSLEKPYLEAGLGLNRILGVIRVDAIWRLTHREAAEGLPVPPPLFTVNVGLDVNF